MKLVKWFLLLVVVTGVTAGWYFYPTADAELELANKDADMLFRVGRSDMVIGILASGTVNARKNHKLSLQAGYSSKVSWLIDENVKVKVGDTLIKFDDSELKNRVEDYALEYENAKKALEIDREELEIQKSSNKADLKQAEDRVRDAEEAFHKYIKLEGPKARDSQQIKLDNALKSLEDAQQKYLDSQTKHTNTVYDSKGAEEAALKIIEQNRKAVEQQELNYDNAVLDRKLFKRYNYPNKIISLENSLEQAKLNLQKTKVRIQSSIIQKDSSIIRQKNSIRRSEKNYNQYKEYLEMMEIKSPVDGVVIYGDPSERWNRLELKVGLQVHKGQVLLTIPDLSSMIVNFDLPEQYRSRVNVDNEVVITPDSLPGLKIRGKITKIAPLPVNQIHWDRGSPKIYKSTVEFSTQDKRLVSGMNAQLEVITKELKDVISIPVESVFEENGEFYVFVSNGGGRPAKQPIIIGAADDDSVEIKKGLKEGDTVYLYNPFFSED